MAPLPIMIIILFLSFESKLSTANINVNSSLTTTEGENSTWAISPSGDFAFGFLKLEESNDYLLAIWYNSIPERTVVWYANGNNSTPSGSKVELTANRLVLTNPQGRIIWEVNPAATISSAEMRNSGNFVLLGTDSTPVWESFRNPTDTILPSQVLNVGDKLFSRLTETNYAKGKYELQFNGDLSLIPIASPSAFQYPSYFNSTTYNVNSSESGYQLVFNQSGKIYIGKKNGDQAQITTWDTSLNYNNDFFYRATLDFYGVFTQYSYPRNPSNSIQTWKPIQSIPENICTSLFNELGSGTCGFNSYCKIDDQSRPTCECPPGHDFVDSINTYGGCKPNFAQGCGPGDDLQNPEILYGFEASEDINFPLNDYERLQPYNETQCKESCLRDCNCAVLVFGADICWKKRWPLSNGKYEPQTSQAGYYTRTMFKIRRAAPLLPGLSDSNGNKDKVILLGVLFGGSAFINVLVLIFSSPYLICKRQSRLEKDKQDSSTREINQQFFTYGELEQLTNGFKEELGRGSFGIVYKGALKFGSKNAVAVKKLDKLAQDREREFRTEVNAIGSTHHKNLVKLIGYCDEGSQRLLIYEFMNGTLADFLFDLPMPDWEKRVKITLGTARGLLYLHEECDVPIIHCDVKPQNILLDDSLTPKISDFGLAKLLLSNQTRTKTMIRGTRGYVAPEWFKNVPITAKVDVYSFGVMLLEIICCRRSVLMDFEEEERAILTDWAYDCFISRRFDLLVENDGLAVSDAGKLEKWVMIAIWCIQEDPSKRPTMKMVMEMLEGFADVPLPPNPSPSLLGLSFVE